MPNLAGLLGRIDDSSLAELLGSHVIRLLALLDPKLNSASVLRNILLKLYTPSELLQNEKSRNIIIDLLRQNDAQFLAQLLNVNNDPNLYRNLKDVKLKKNSSELQIINGFFEISPLDEKVEKKSVEFDFIQPKYGLYDYQRILVKEVNESFSIPPFRTMLHMPTGAGKTRTAMRIIADRFIQHPKKFIIWLSTSEELCEQAATEFSRAWSNLGNRDLPLIRFWGEMDININTYTEGFLVCGLAKLFSYLKRKSTDVSRLSKNCSLVIIDEAHISVAQTYKLLIEQLLINGTNVACLGLTATPGRSYNNINLDEELVNLFAGRKITLKFENHSNPIEALIQRSFLSKASYSPLFYAGNKDVSSSDLKEIEQSLEIPEHILKKLGEDEQRNLKIIQVLQTLTETHSRIIYFAPTIENSDLIATILTVKGMDAKSITSRTEKSTRNNAIELYKSLSAETKILCNYGILTTGFDAPKTSAVVIARPTKSLILYTQMIGRALRGKKSGGNDTSEIITIVDQNLPGFASLVEAFTNWEDVWEQK